MPAPYTVTVCEKFYIVLVMNIEDFQRALTADSRAAVVDVWAPWCGPCKAMAPVFEKLADEYAEEVQVIRINADESHDLVGHLDVFAIPTVVAFNGDGSEAGRRTGAQREGDLRGFFQSLLAGRPIAAVSNRDRLIRIGAALAAAAFAPRVEPSWPLYILAGGLFFSAIHDRCPLWQAIKRVVRSKSGGAA